MIRNQEKAFEYTKPRFSSNELLWVFLRYGGICNTNGIGFIDAKTTSPEILARITTLNKTAKFTKYSELVTAEFPDATIVFVTVNENLSANEIKKIIDFRTKNRIGRVVVLFEGEIVPDEFYAPKFFSIEANQDGFFVKPYLAEEKKSGVLQRLKTLIANALSNHSTQAKTASKPKYAWNAKEKIHHYSNAKSLLDLFFQARKTSRKISQIDERDRWGVFHFKQTPDEYDYSFAGVMPEGIYELLKSKDSTGLTSVLDLFSDPTMVRTLKDEGHANLVTAVGLTDSRTTSERDKDQKLGVNYIFEAGSAGLWTGRTFAKIRTQIENSERLKQAGGFDLVIARPVGGWQIGKRPPFDTQDGILPPFEMQYVLLNRMWQFVGENGTLLVKMPANSHAEMRLYSEQLLEDGFVVTSHTDDSPSTYTSEVRIDRNASSPKTLPRPRIFRAENGIT